jgi:hypothetical protein
MGDELANVTRHGALFGFGKVAGSPLSRVKIASRPGCLLQRGPIVSQLKG